MRDRDVKRQVEEIVGNRFSISNNNGVYLVEKKAPSRVLSWLRNAAAIGVIAAQSMTYAADLGWSARDEQLYEATRHAMQGRNDVKPQPEGNFDGIEKLIHERVRVRGVEEADKKHGWFLTGGECIYDSPLKESEKEIGMIDDIGFSLIPDWKRLTTFSDFRDKGLLSDFFIGGGKHLGEHFSAYADIGGGYGYINNHHTYGLLTTHFDFARWDVYAELNGEWFPLGKTHPEFKETGMFKRLIEGAKQAKPVVAVTLGYSLQGSDFHVKFKGPFGNKLFGFRQNDEYEAKYVTPTVGVVMPITINTDLVTKVGYAIIDVHKDEMQGPAVLMGFEHTFGRK